MKYSVLFRDRAVTEMQEAYDWYEKQVYGLGDTFLSIIKNKLSSSFLFFIAVEIIKRSLNAMDKSYTFYRPLV